MYERPLIVDIETPLDLDQAVMQEQAYRTAALCSSLVKLSMDFASIERVPRYCPERRENNAEHSYMLGMVATEMARTYHPNLDSGLITQLSLIHDLPELIDNDTPTFKIDEAALQAKATREAAATTELVGTILPPYIGSLLVRYEKQLEPETRFVRLVDKLLPVAVDIHGPGRQVMEEDYDVYTAGQLEDAESVLRARFRNMFPDNNLSTLHMARDILADEFAGVFAAGEPQSSTD